MTRAAIKHIAGDHYKKLQKYSRKITRDFDPEVIHKFRVEFKKLRAFLRLLSQAEEVNQEIKISKKLKSLYTVAGRLRDLQLQQLQVREAAKAEITKPAAYYYLLHKQIEKQKTRIRKRVLTASGKYRKSKTISLLPGCCTLPRFEDYEKSSMQSARDVLGEGRFLDSDLHMIRKILKDLFYNSRIYPEEKEHASKKSKEQELDDLLDALGNYQDRCTAISLLKPAWLRKMTPGNRQQLLRIKEAWLKEKEIRKQVLIARLHNEFMPGDHMPPHSRIDEINPSL